MSRLRHQQPDPVSNPHRRRGFTVMELLVSISIAVLVMSLAGRIMVETSNAVTEGMALSEVISGGRVISDQLQRDAAQMVGPGGLTAQADPRTFALNPGRGGVLIITNQQVNATRMLRGGEEQPGQPIRSDGLYFIRANRLETSMTPASDTSLGSSLAAPYLLVSYIHAQRANNAGNLGDVGSPDELSSRWILARQATHLWERSLPSGQTRSVAELDASQRWDGLTDVARFSLHNPDSPQGSANRLLVGRSDSSARLRAGAGYAGTAADLLTFASNRLRVNPAPSMDTVSIDDIAQQHPILMAGVSGFEVAFSFSSGSDPVEWHDMNNAPPESVRSFSGRTNAQVGWVFQHDDFEGRQWPTLIRVRYRLHDHRARLSDGDDAGRMFEQIIRVVRPR
ncbi:MAG: prepilin-type N-terminal cleavage/methylation domain-containing protein [Phycisphaeraceae bacterium]|nr:prepilin-type N-terminal cleavage/methylation domain-containing protein [Phycisphaeraceae bacterium]